MRRRRKHAFSLIELLCVMAIIFILCSLMAGPMVRAHNKARNLKWENDSIQLLDQFRGRMSQHFGSAPSYPALSVDQLYDGALIDSNLRRFLRDKRVRFFPFSSETPDNTVVLIVRGSKGVTAILHKVELKPPE